MSALCYVTKHCNSRFFALDITIVGLICLHGEKYGVLSMIPKYITYGIVQLWHHSHSFELLFCPIVAGKITSFIQNTSHQCILIASSKTITILCGKWSIRYLSYHIVSVCYLCGSSGERERERESDLIRDEVNCAEKWVIPFVQCCRCFEYYHSCQSLCAHIYTYFIAVNA